MRRRSGVFLAGAVSGLRAGQKGNRRGSFGCSGSDSLWLLGSRAGVVGACGHSNFCCLERNGIEAEGCGWDYFCWRRSLFKCHSAKRWHSAPSLSVITAGWGGGGGLSNYVLKYHPGCFSCVLPSPWVIPGFGRFCDSAVLLLPPPTPPSIPQTCQVGNAARPPEGPPSWLLP